MDWQQFRGLYQLIWLLRWAGIVLAPVFCYFLLRNRQDQRRFYDEQSRYAMAFANAAGIVLACAWFVWSAAFWCRPRAPLY